MLAKDYAGKSRDSWLAVERSFLMVRSQGKLFTPACLYERVRGADAPSIQAFHRIEVKNNRGQPVSDGRAMAYRIALNSGKQIDVLISFDAEGYTAAECVANKTRRIAVRARTVASDD
jgi:hypothetical protein